MAATVVDATVEYPGFMLVEDVATGDRQRVASDLMLPVGQHVVVQCRRWVIVGREARPEADRAE